MVVPANCALGKLKQERKAQIEQWINSKRSQEKEKSEATPSKLNPGMIVKTGKRSETKTTAKPENILEAAPKKRKISMVPQ